MSKLKKLFSRKRKNPGPTEQLEPTKSVTIALHSINQKQAVQNDVRKLRLEIDGRLLPNQAKARELCQKIKERYPAVKELTLIPDVGGKNNCPVEFLAELLRVYPGVTHFSVSDVILQEGYKGQEEEHKKKPQEVKGEKAFTQALKGTSHLQALHLEDNVPLTSGETEADRTKARRVADMLAMHPHLTEVTLSFSFIDEEVMGWLQKGLKSNPALAVLNLRSKSGQISDKTAQVLKVILTDNPSIKQATFPKVSKEQAEEIYTQLARNQKGNQKKIPQKPNPKDFATPVLQRGRSRLEGEGVVETKGKWEMALEAIPEEVEEKGRVLENKEDEIFQAALEEELEKEEERIALERVEEAHVAREEEQKSWKERTRAGSKKRNPIQEGQANEGSSKKRKTAEGSPAL